MTVEQEEQCSLPKSCVQVGDGGLALCPEEQEFGSLLYDHSYPAKMGKEGCCKGRTAGRNLI